MNIFLKTLTNYIEKILVFLLSLIFVITFILVLLRYVFNQSITGANEIVTIMFIYTTAFGSALSIEKREHISINMVINKLKPDNLKKIRYVQYILIFSLHAMLLLFCLEWINTAGGYLMPATGLPRIVVISSIPFGCVLALMYCLKHLIKPVGSN
tara:strand:+ start:510 stop:974 length:465 start_codon:yes stop_codon:yes gene_type:complete